MSASKQLLTAVAYFLLGAPVSAFWRMECRGQTGIARIDPLVSPGTVAAHVHTIFGSGGFSESSGTEALLASDCTSCAAVEDKSAYWSPVPYFQDSETGEFEAVKVVGGMLAYYLLNAAPSGDQSIRAFPAGFQMISGDTDRRNYTAGDGDYTVPDPPKSNWASLGQNTQSDLAQRAIGFNCLDYTKSAEGSLYRHFLPSKEYIDANCPDGIRAELMFPTCWDGVNLDSADHRSHVAFPDLVINGECPEGFPVRLPGLFFETIWDFHAFNDRNGSFVFSNGDPLGFGYHGDFIMGWDEDLLQNAVNTCTSTSGLVTDCPLFTIQSEATMKECKIDTPAALTSEDVDGPMSSMPGNAIIYYGPEPAPGENSGDTTATATTPTATVVAPTLGYSAGETASVDGSYLPGQVFLMSSSSSAPTGGFVVKGNARVSTDAPVPTDAASYSIISTEYVTATSIVSEIIYEEEIFYVTEETTTTVWVPPTASGAAGRKRRDDHVHAHRHVHGRMH